MLDLKLIREDPDGVRAALVRRGAGERVDELLEVDRRRREILPELEGLRGERKRVSAEVGEAKKAGREAPEAVEQVREMKAEMEKLEGELAEAEAAEESGVA